MAHFAKIENSVVTEIVVINNDVVGTEFPASEPIGQQFLTNHGYDGVWVQTSFNNNFRKQYGLVGSTYNEENNIFILAQPFPSWTLDSNFDWQPPSPKPTDYFSRWDESLLSWIRIDY
jgi:hypothetical protein